MPFAAPHASDSDASASLRQLANAQHGAVFLGPTRTASTARQRRAWQSTSPTSNRPHRTATPTPGPRGDVRPLGKHNRSYIQFSVLRSGGTRTDSVLRQSPLGKRDIRWVVPPSSRLAGFGGRCGGAGLHRLRSWPRRLFIRANASTFKPPPGSPAIHKRDLRCFSF